MALNSTYFVKEFYIVLKNINQIQFIIDEWLWTIYNLGWENNFRSSSAIAEASEQEEIFDDHE